MDFKNLDNLSYDILEAKVKLYKLLISAKPKLLSDSDMELAIKLSEDRDVQNFLRKYMPKT